MIQSCEHIFSVLIFLLFIESISIFKNSTSQHNKQSNTPIKQTQLSTEQIEISEIH